MSGSVGAWLNKTIEAIRGEKTTDWTFVDRLPDPGLADVPLVSIKPDEAYIEIFVESMRLKQARRFGTGFHGLVYLFARLSQEGAEDADLAAVSKPAKLAELDASNLDRVITVSDRMMGAVPWRGGSLALELGLFSVKKGNLLSPLLDYVARVSEVGGISFIGQVKPFLPLITQGMDLIAGQTQDAAIEVAIDTTLTLNESRLCAIVGMPKGSLGDAKLTLDPSDRKLLCDGRPLEEAYCVFSIRGTDQKADYGAIPELKASWAELRSAIQSNDRTRADNSLGAFSRAVLVSPDLINRDKERLVAKAKQLLASAFPKGPAPVSRKVSLSEIGKAELSVLRLYD
ncbi:hypothetical protein ACC779_36250 [Rhizobium ruizarguesonis]